MSAAKTPFDTMLQMGQDWAKAVNPALEQFTPDAMADLWPTPPKEFLETFMGKTFNPEGLDAKTRLLLTAMGLTVLGAQNESQMTLTLRNARAAGATQQEVAETIAMAAMFGGSPAMSKAMELATAVFTDEEGQS